VEYKCQKYRNRKETPAKSYKNTVRKKGHIFSKPMILYGAGSDFMNVCPPIMLFHLPVCTPV